VHVILSVLAKDLCQPSIDARSFANTLRMTSLSNVYHRFAWLATFIGKPNKSMNPRAAVTS